MFAIDRFEPSEQAKPDKSHKLASFNERFKRKRGTSNALAVEKLPKAETSSVKAATEVQQEIEILPRSNDIDLQIKSPISERRPHREKKSKPTRPSQEVTDDGPSKVSHILDKFHKYQDHSNKHIRETTQAQSAVASEPVVVSDLAPVPQVRRSNAKKSSVPVTAGVSKYLQVPNIVSTSSSVPFKSFSLCKKLQENLTKCGFENAFAVQAAVLPVILSKHLPEDRKDFLVSAPTGSGKTLAYVLPILEVLQSRRITRLRAIVIVPTRELVQQVQSTFESLSSRLGLKIESLSATRPFTSEQGLLVNDYEPYAPSNIDILICTPGRLVDHIKSTPRFTLRDLRFLVIDEGDRLLNQSFQGWSAEIDEALKPLHTEEAQTLDIFTTRSEERCQKLIFSATLSTDPSLLAQLNLINPSLYLVQNTADTDKDDLLTRFTTPSTLDEFFIHSPESIPKPLVLLTTLHRMKISKALIFTNSNESAIKLTTLMNRMDLGRCESFTSTLTPSFRRRHLADFSSSKDTSDISFLVCSDLMARGIDISVGVVINYDSSISVRQYIHRVGRTARAGHEGRAISLVEAAEGKYWWNQIGKKVSRNKPIQRVTMFPKRTDALENPISDSQHDQDSDSDMNSTSESDEDDEDQDERTASSDVQDTVNKKKALVIEEPSPQIHLEQVDQEALERVYREALRSLQNES